MGIRKLGYYHWTGSLAGRWRCWLSITGNGIRLGLKQKFCQALIFSGMSTALVGGITFYLLKSAVDAAGEIDKMKLGAVLFFTGLINKIDVTAFNFENMLVPLWALIILKLCSMEMVWLVLILSRVGPSQIAGDLRTNALPIYFSKPVNGASYLAGKWLTNMVFALLVTLLPGVLAYLSGIMMTGHMVPPTETLGLLAGVVMQAVAMAGIGSVLVLGLSALFRNEWFVTVAWVSLTLITHVVQYIIDHTLGDPSSMGGQWTAGGFLGSISLWRNFNRLSYYFLGLNRLWQDQPESAGQLAQKAVRTEALQHDVMYSVVVLAIMVAASLLVSVLTVRKFKVSVANQ